MLVPFTYYLLILTIITKHSKIFCEGTDLCWRDYNGTIPSDAYYAEDDIYIGQTLHLPHNQEGGLLPGGLYLNRHQLIFEAHGKRKEHIINIKILCTSTPHLLKWKWINMRDLQSNLTDDYVVGGYEVKRSLYIGKNFHDGEWKIGKVFPHSNEGPDRNGLRIWNKDGKALSAQDFQILTKLHQLESSLDILSALGIESGVKTS